MSEIINVAAENPSETKVFFKAVAEQYRGPKNQQNTLDGFPQEIRNKLNIRSPKCDPDYDFSQAIIEQTLHNKEWIDRRGGLKKTSDDFLRFIENMGINPQDPSAPLKKLAEEYLLRPYVTKVHKETPAVVETPQKLTGKAPISTKTPITPSGEGETPIQAAETAEATTAPEEEAPPEIPETPAQREGRIREMLAGLNDFLAQPGEEATALRKRLAEADRETFETLTQAVISLASKVPDLFGRKPQEIAEEAGAEAAETPERKEGKITGILRGVNEFLSQPSDEAARLKEADREAFDNLQVAFKSFSEKVSGLFRRSPQETLTAVPAEAPIATAPEPALPEITEETEAAEQKPSNVARVLRGVNEFLAQPGDEAARLRQQDRENFINMVQTIQRFPALFGRLLGKTQAETEIPGRGPDNVRLFLDGVTDFLNQPNEEVARLRQNERESFETMIATVRKFPNAFERIFRKGAERQPEETTLTPEEQKTSAARKMLAGLNDFLAQPGEKTTRLRERLATADRETFETLTQAVISLASKVPDLFGRKPQEEAAEVEAEAAETPTQREGRIRGILKGMNEFLAQPSDETARLRAADQQASENLTQALRSLTRRVPDLFRRTPQEETETAQPAEPATETETPAQRTSKIRWMLGGLGKRSPKDAEEAKPEDLTNEDLEEMIFDNEKRSRQNRRALGKTRSDAEELNPSISQDELALLPLIQKINQEYDDLADKFAPLQSELERRFQNEELIEILSRIRARVEEAEAQEEAGANKPETTPKTSRTKGILKRTLGSLARKRTTPQAEPEDAGPTQTPEAPEPPDDPRFGSYERFPTLAGILRPNRQEIADDLAKAEEAEKTEEKQAFQRLNVILENRIPDPRFTREYYDIPPSILKTSIASIDPDRIHGGKVTVDDRRNVTIKGVEVSDPKNPGAKATFNIIISNLDYFGIKAFAQRASTTSSGGFDTKKIEDGLEKINSIVMDQINKGIADRNPSWAVDHIGISYDGMISAALDKEPADLGLEQTT